MLQSSRGLARDPESRNNNIFTQEENKRERTWDIDIIAVESGI